MTNRGEQFVCAQTARILSENISCLNGTVDIYPALNPLGIDSINRGIPLFDLDMNRIFPGTYDGAIAECIAADIINDISGADICIDIHSSNIYLKEIPQIRINEINADELVPYAKLLNCDFIWVHSSATVLESTLAYSLNTTGTKTLVVEMGVGMRITAVDAILRFMSKRGIINAKIVNGYNTEIISENRLIQIHSQIAGIYKSYVKAGDEIQSGNLLCEIIDPLEGNTISKIYSPINGIVFFRYNRPLEFEKTVLYKIIQI